MTQRLSIPEDLLDFSIDQEIFAQLPPLLRANLDPLERQGMITDLYAFLAADEGRKLDPDLTR